MARALSVPALDAPAESFIGWVSRTLAGPFAPEASRRADEFCWHTREWSHSECDIAAWESTDAHERMEDAACNALAKVAGVDAVFLSGEGDERSLIVVAREHSDVDRELLVNIEDQLSERFGYVEIQVRAHQGRPLKQYEGLRQIV